MYWSWNSGYLFMKMEGTSAAVPATANIDHKFWLHVGGYGGGWNGAAKTVNNLRTVTLPITNQATVRGNVAPVIHLFVDATENYWMAPIKSVWPPPIAYICPQRLPPWLTTVRPCSKSITFITTSSNSPGPAIWPGQLATYEKPYWYTAADLAPGFEWVAYELPDDRPSGAAGSPFAKPANFPQPVYALDQNRPDKSRVQYWGGPYSMTGCYHATDQSPALSVIIKPTHLPTISMR